MTNDEKTLYHQIHPLKLLTDWGTGIYALYPLWKHQLGLALIIMFIPPIIVSFILIRFADLEKYRQSAFGTYIKKYMTHQMEAVRFGGFILMAIGAWLHMTWMIPLGLLVVLFGWLRGTISRSNCLT